MRKNSSARQKRKEALLKRIRDGQERQTGGFKSILKPGLKDVTLYAPSYKKQEDHLIDILCYRTGNHDPVTDEGLDTYTCEVFVHTRIGPQNQDHYICLQENYGERCPICEHRAQLRKEGVDDKIWKALYPKKRNLYNVISYDNEKEEMKGVQIFNVAFFYMEEHLLALAKRPIRPGKRVINPYVEFMESGKEDGKTISFAIVPAKGEEDYPSFIGHKFEDRDYDIDDELLNSVHCLDELLHIPTYDEVYEAYFWGENDKSSEITDGEPNEELNSEDNSEGPEEESLEDELEKLSESGLKKYIKKNDIDLDIDPDWGKQDLIDAIVFTVEDDGEQGSSAKKCPAGGEFGKDAGDYEECEDCKHWDDCLGSEEQERKSKEEKEEKQEKKTRTRKRSR